MPEPVLVTEPDSSPLLAQAPRIASGTALPGPGASTAQLPITPPKPATVPNARKGYKLTLWVSATTDAGVSDVNGLLQLDGADPVPFCMLKGVRNPLARALQEAYVAIERVRAKPPRMAAPTASPAGPQHGPPRPQSAPRATAAARHPPATPSTSRAAGEVGSAPTPPPDPPTPTRRPAMSQQASLF
jgi:hypothetical protein